MGEILSKLAMFFGYPFVLYALIVGVLIALCSSLLGVTLILKRFSFIGDGLSHVAFGAMATASVLKLAGDSDILFTMPITVICAVLLLRTNHGAKIKGDAAVAMISVEPLAVGYLLMNLFSTASNLSGDVCSTLFGSTSILTLTSAEVKLCAGLSVTMVVLFVLFYNRIFAVTFDEDFAKASGTRANLYNLLIAVITAVIIVFGDEPRRFAPDIRAGDIPRAFGYADFQKLSFGDGLLGCAVGAWRAVRDFGFDSFRNARRLDHSRH